MLSKLAMALSVAGAVAFLEDNEQSMLEVGCKKKKTGNNSPKKAAAEAEKKAAAEAEKKAAAEAKKKAAAEAEKKAAAEAEKKTAEKKAAAEAEHAAAEKVHAAAEAAHAFAEAELVVEKDDNKGPDAIAKAEAAVAAAAKAVQEAAVKMHEAAQKTENEEKIAKAAAAVAAGAAAGGGQASGADAPSTGPSSGSGGGGADDFVMPADGKDLEKFSKLLGIANIKHFKFAVQDALLLTTTELNAKFKGLNASALGWNVNTLKKCSADDLKKLQIRHAEMKKEIQVLKDTKPANGLKNWFKGPVESKAEKIVVPTLPDVNKAVVSINKKKSVLKAADGSTSSDLPTSRTWDEVLDKLSIEDIIAVYYNLA